ncbi:unnamed protein product [Linum tenue]|uniref:Cytochrome c oxidase assembly factor 5 n=1 Tax=Linum tenue TaxID=586396 RepID=A0AAV0LHQ7_9ROSI|nr:unnamed protein product [Linum tenue]
MAKSCKGLATELVKCLSESDCVKVGNRSIRDCAGEKSPSVSSECVGLRETYFNCKRGQARFHYIIPFLFPHSSTFNFDFTFAIILLSCWKINVNCLARFGMEQQIHLTDV